MHFQGTCYSKMEKVGSLSLRISYFRFGPQHVHSCSKTRFNVKLANTKQIDINVRFRVIGQSRNDLTNESSFKRNLLVNVFQHESSFVG